MRKQLFKFFLWTSVGLGLLTVFLFTELSYVGVKIQYFLIPAVALTSFFTWIFYKEDSNYFD